MEGKSAIEVDESRFHVLQTWEAQGLTVDLCVEVAALELVNQTGQEVMNPPTLLIRKVEDGGT